MNVLILDTETTGLKTDRDQVIEVAGILYSVDNKTILMQMSTLLSVLHNDAEFINKIPSMALRENSVEVELILDSLIKMSTHATYIVAHNAEFDKSFTKKHPVLKKLNEEDWICTLNDVEWPYKFPGGYALSNIAINYGLPVFGAHRALNDCTLLAGIFSKEPNIKTMLEEATLPKKIFKANIPYAMRELAKGEGFSWNTIIPNAWAKKMTDLQAGKIKFDIEEVFLN